jgi:hypothetical protein
MPVTEHPPLVGREVEQRALREAVDAAAAGGPPTRLGADAECGDDRVIRHPEARRRRDAPDGAALLG